MKNAPMLLIWVIFIGFWPTNGTLIMINISIKAIANGTRYPSLTQTIRELLEGEKVKEKLLALNYIRAEIESWEFIYYTANSFFTRYLPPTSRFICRTRIHRLTALTYFNNPKRRLNFCKLKSNVMGETKLCQRNSLRPWSYCSGSAILHLLSVIVQK